VNNLFNVVPQNAVVFVNWDPFIFPFNYYQYVEKQRTDVIVVDQELLRRSWYIQSLRIHHTEFMKHAETEIDEFLEAVRPFEEKEKFDGNFIQSKYVAMINALIDRSYEKGNDVFLTYDPPTGVAEKYFKESVVAAVKLRKGFNTLTPVNMEALQFKYYFDSTVPLDRMARFFKTYYGRLFFARGFVAEKLNQPAEALSLYEKASEFLHDNPAFIIQVNEARQRLSKISLK
jgi:tetratricopeptide (TPR) repeat protein